VWILDATSRHLGWGITLLGGLLLLAGGAGGCAISPHNGPYFTEARKARGLVIVLPGIEGVSPLNKHIREGLCRAGVDCAVIIYPWGRPYGPAAMLINQVDVIGNRMAALQLGRMIEGYQQTYHAPVWLVGHSGGGGIAVLTAENLPPGRKVQGLILLSSSISDKHDLTAALEHTRKGIVNFYNPEDIALLGVGTTILTNVDGVHGPSAGLTGFVTPENASPRTQQLYKTKLFQFAMDSRVTGGLDPHTSSTDPGFVSRYVAPWVLRSTWPPYSQQWFDARR